MVLEYYGRLCTLWEEYAIYKPLPICTCGAAHEISTEREEEKVNQFILDLDNSRYGRLCTTLIGMELMPYVGEVYSKVIREEQRLTSSWIREHQQDAVGFATRQFEESTRIEVAPGRSENQNVTKSDT